MKKLFKLLSLLSLVRELRGARRHSYGGHDHYRRSRDYYPLHDRGYRRHRSLRQSLLTHLLRRVAGGRRY